MPLQYSRAALVSLPAITVFLALYGFRERAPAPPRIPQSYWWEGPSGRLDTSLEELATALPCYPVQTPSIGRDTEYPEHLI